MASGHHKLRLLAYGVQEGRAFRFGHELHMAHGDRLLDLAERMGTSVEQLVATNYNRLTHIHNPDRPGRDAVICVVPSFRQSKVPLPPFPLPIFAFLRLHRHVTPFSLVACGLSPQRSLAGCKSTTSKKARARGGDRRGAVFVCARAGRLESSG